MSLALSRAGFAVLAVLLLLLGLTCLAHAALVTAVRERAASALEARLILRRLAARTAARVPLLEDTLPTLGTETLLMEGAHDAIRWRTGATALGAELVLLTGGAEIDGLAGEARTGSLAWHLDPSARAAHAAAVVEVGGGVELAGGELSASAWLDPEEIGGAAALDVCGGELRALDSLDARAPPLVAALPGGTSLPGLGLMPGDTLLARALFQLAGPVTPEPISGWGSCELSPTNWGSPSDPAGSCGTRFVHVGAAGDLSLRGGEGQGALIVRGSLHLYEGARFDGVALVGGDLVIEQGARLVGLARVAGTLRVRLQGSVDGSACAVARALRSLPALRALMPLGDGGRVHPL